jgi:hypothetical protein
MWNRSTVILILIGLDSQPDLLAIAISAIKVDNDVIPSSSSANLSTLFSAFASSVNFASSHDGSQISIKQPDTAKIHEYIRAIAPEPLEEMRLPNVSNSTELLKLDGDAQLLSLAIYMASNNLLKEKQATLIINFFSLSRNRQLLTRLFSLKTPGIEAFAEKLFKFAIVASDIHVVKACLDVGVSPDVMGHVSVYETPLEQISYYGDIKLAKLLLEAGADANYPARKGKDCYAFRYTTLAIN